MNNEIEEITINQLIYRLVKSKYKNLYTFTEENKMSYGATHISMGKKETSIMTFKTALSFFKKLDEEIVISCGLGTFKLK